MAGEIGGGEFCGSGDGVAASLDFRYGGRTGSGGTGTAGGKGKPGGNVAPALFDEYDGRGLHVHGGVPECGTDCRGCVLDGVDGAEV